MLNYYYYYYYYLLYKRIDSCNLSANWLLCFLRLLHCNDAVEVVCEKALLYGPKTSETTLIPI